MKLFTDSGERRRVLYCMLGALFVMCLGLRAKRAAEASWIFFAWAFPAFAFGIGMARIKSFFPALDDGYREWLETVCWKYPMPLPFGPPHLTLGDFITVTAYMAAMMALKPDPSVLLLYPAAMMAGYLTVLILSLFTIGYWMKSFVLFYVMMIAMVCVGGAVFLGIPMLEAGKKDISLYVGVVSLGLAVPIYIAALVVVQNALRSFPWDVEGAKNQISTGFSMAKHLSSNMEKVGWPMNILSPDDRVFEWPRCHVVIAFLLIAVPWFVLCRFAFHDMINRGNRILLIFPLLVSVLIICGRVIMYLKGHAASPGIMERLATGHLIVPSFDVVFVAPLLSLLAGAAAFMSLSMWLKYDYGPGVALGFIVHWAIALFGGPSYRTWRLTSACRYVRSSLKAESADLSVFFDKNKREEWERSKGDKIGP